MNWIDKAFGIHPQALMFRSERSNILAANIANADTPDYQARDLDFKNVMKNIQNDSMMRSVEVRSTNPNHISISDDQNFGSLMYRIPTRVASNGNTVEAEVEQAAFSDNALRYQASLNFFEGNVTGLIRAFKGE